MSNLNLEGLKDGLTKVKVVSGGLSDSVDLEVVEEVLTEELIGDRRNLYIDESVFSHMGRGESSRYGTHEWTNNTPELVKINPKGSSCEIIGLKEGVYSVTYTWRYFDLSYTKNTGGSVIKPVYEELNRVELALARRYGVVGEKIDMTILRTPYRSNITDMKWIVFPEDSIKIENGYFTILKAGKVKINLTVNGDISSNEIEFNANEPGRIGPSRFNISFEGKSDVVLQTRQIIQAEVIYELDGGGAAIERALVQEAFSDFAYVSYFLPDAGDPLRATITLTGKQAGEVDLNFKSVVSEASSSFKVKVIDDHLLLSNEPDFLDVDKSYKLNISASTGEPSRITKVAISPSLRLVDSDSESVTIEMKQITASSVPLFVRVTATVGDKSLTTTFFLSKKARDEIPLIEKDLPKYLVVKKGEPVNLDVRIGQGRSSFFWSSGGKLLDSAINGVTPKWDIEEANVHENVSRFSIPYASYDLEPYIMVRMLSFGGNPNAIADSFCMVRVVDELPLKE